MRQTLRAAAAALVAVAIGAPAAAQTEASREQQLEQAKETIDTSRFKKDPPYTIGLSAGYLTNSWVVFAQQHILYEAAQHPEIAEVIITDANFNPAKQVADIEDLVSKGVDLILYWPVDEQAIQGALQKAVEQGIATISTGGAFSAGRHRGQRVHRPVEPRRAGGAQAVRGPGRARQDLRHAADRRDHRGGRPARRARSRDEGVPGHRAAVREYGDWNRAKAKQITENLLQRFPRSTASSRPRGRCRSASPRPSRRRAASRRS